MWCTSVVKSRSVPRSDGGCEVFKSQTMCVRVGSECGQAPEGVVNGIPTLRSRESCRGGQVSPTEWVRGCRACACLGRECGKLGVAQKGDEDDVFSVRAANGER